MPQLDVTINGPEDLAHHMLDLLGMVDSGTAMAVALALVTAQLGRIENAADRDRAVESIKKHLAVAVDHIRGASDTFEHMADAARDGKQ